MNEEVSAVMDEDEMRRAITRIAHEIVERNKGAENLVVIGIQNRGVPLGQRLARLVGEIEGTRVPFGSLNIALYRDDFETRHPAVGRTDIPFDINGKNVVLVDEVLYTGRTTRSAMDAIVDMGRPAKVQLAVLIDRGHRELPIRPDYVGKNLPTSREQKVEVRWGETTGKDEVIIRTSEE